MGQFRNTETDVVVSVDDSKDSRFTGGGWEAVSAGSKKAPAKKAATSGKTDK